MVVQRKPMTNSPYFLFHQSLDQLRRIGARGGKAQARSRRLRLQLPAHAQPRTVATINPVAATAAQAITILDAQFPWLSGAEKRRTPRRPQRSSLSLCFPTFARRPRSSLVSTYVNSVPTQPQSRKLSIGRSHRLAQGGSRISKKRRREEPGGVKGRRFVGLLRNAVRALLFV
jgi:hypothetical protein